MADGDQQGGDDLRRAWKAKGLVPLWESPTAHKDDEGPEPPQIWRWAEIRPLVLEALKVTSPEAVERRVLSLVNPRNTRPEDESSVRNISAAIQVLNPGDAARPHRHSMNALRFVLEGQGAITHVDGAACLMEPGDMILTPGWTWHAHEHPGEGPIVWLDVLDVPFHLTAGTASFEPGPAHDVPDADPAAYRYPWAEAKAALGATSVQSDGARHWRYADRETGGASMATLDTYLVGLDVGAGTTPQRSSANAVYCVAAGEGTSRVGETELSWSKYDIFTVPQGNWLSHTAPEGAILFTVSDREIYRRLDLLNEEAG